MKKCPGSGPMYTSAFVRKELEGHGIVDGGARSRRFEAVRHLSLTLLIVKGFLLC